MDAKKKLAVLIAKAKRSMWGQNGLSCELARNMYLAEIFAERLIDNGVTVQEWISASEPPKDTYEYWIAYKAGGDYFYSTGYFDGKCWRSAITHKQIPVTHWQHLPQPPKGE